MGAADHVVLVSLPGFGVPLTDRTCTLESINPTTGRPTATFELPAGRVPVAGAVFGPDGTAAVFSPDGTAVAFQLARAGRRCSGPARQAAWLLVRCAC